MTQAPEFRLVPVEPTEAMLIAAMPVRQDWTFLDSWRAMLEAAPHTAAPAADRAVSEPIDVAEITEAWGQTGFDDYAPGSDIFHAGARWMEDRLTTPPADRAELIDALRLSLAYENPKLGPTGRIVAKSVLQAAIDALARSTDAPSEPVSWGYANTVGNAIAQLKTMDAALPIFGALHLDDGRCIARGLTFSRERVVGGRWIHSRDDSVPYSIVAWTQDRNALATPPAAATSATQELPCLKGRRLPNQPCPRCGAERAEDECTIPSAATSTPCASGEAKLMSAEQVADAIESEFSRTGEWPEGDVQIAHAVQRALAATQAPTPCDECGAIHAPGQNTLCTDSRTPTACNTEDARSMGAVSDTQMLDFLARLGDFSAGSVPSIPHDYEVRTEDDRVFKGESLRGCIRAALTQAASTGGAAS